MSSRRSRGAVVVAAALAVGVAGPATVAQADHTNARELCSQQYEGVYTHSYRVPIYTGEVVGGWISMNYRIVDGGDNVKWCAVTVRKHHGERKFTVAKIKRSNESDWRADSGDFFEYAGPVMRELSYTQAGRCLDVYGRIGNWIESFRQCNGLIEV